MAAAGMHVPALEARPSIVGYRWLWEAFNALDSCRVNAMSVGRIPWTAVQQYAEAHKLDEEETWTLHEVIQHLDSLFISHHAEKQKQS